MADIYKTKTGGVGPSGEPIFDVFEGEEHIKDPNDPRIAGKSMDSIATGLNAPAGFKSQFPTPTPIVSSSNEYRGEVKGLGNDLTRFQDFLTQLGIEKPTDTTSPIVNEILTGLKNRQAEMDKRRTEDEASLEKSYGTAKGELERRQQEAFERASGRTRIGGFINREELSDLERMQRQFRLELAGLEGQKQTAIQQARRSYDDQNYELARTQLESAKNLEEQTYQRNNDYFNNILKFQQSQKPVVDLDEVSQKAALEAMSKYPSGFVDMEPEDFQNISLSEINQRVVRSSEYKQELSGQKERQPIEVSPGATLFDPVTGRSIFTAPTTKQVGGITTGTTPPQVKLSAAQQTDVADMRTMLSQLDKMDEVGELKGAVGFFTGPLESTALKLFGQGNERDAEVRAMIGNVKAQLAKLRGGTSFTENEQKLLESYVPSINESPESIVAKVRALRTYLSSKMNQVISAAGGTQDGSSADPLGLFK